MLMPIKKNIFANQEHYYEISLRFSTEEHLFYTRVRVKVSTHCRLKGPQRKKKTLFRIARVPSYGPENPQIVWSGVGTHLYVCIHIIRCVRAPVISHFRTVTH